MNHIKLLTFGDQSFRCSITIFKFTPTINPLIRPMKKLMKSRNGTRKVSLFLQKHITINIII